MQLPSNSRKFGWLAGVHPPTTQISGLFPKVEEMGEQTNPLSLEQREPILRTKLFVPPIRSNRVARPRLIDQINGGLEKALTLISAPAGYGKTTLVSVWLGEADVKSAWLSLDEGDNDPIRFLQYFITALQQIVPRIQPDLLGVLQGMQPAPYNALLNILINEIAGRAAPFVLILDDFHTLHAQPVLEMITYLLDHMPPQMHVVLISRTDPPLPLSRLRARNQLVDIRANQLCFTQEETAFFLNDVMGLTLSTDDIAAMEARTEGWIAGLQLASIALQATASQSHNSMQGDNDVHRFVSAFTGSHYYIMDYLAEEALTLQTETVRSFLLQTSILSRLCGPLCDAVTELDTPDINGGQVMLEAIEQMNLFLIPLDKERHWYRYHHLFADVLNRRLEQLFPQKLPDLHRRASQWYEQNGFIYDAIQHALMAGDQERAAHLVDQNGCLLLMRGEVINLLDWIKAVEPCSQSLPWIAIQKAWALALTGQLDRVEAPLQTAEQLIARLEPADDVGTMLGAVAAARAYHANMRGEARLAADFARQALDRLPVSNDFSCSLRSAATSILGDASWMDGDLAEARRAYTDAVQISESARDIHMGIITNSNLASILMELGQLHQAARIYAETLKMATLPDGQISPLAERGYAGLSSVTYEWNRLEDTAEYVHNCIELSQRWGSIEFQATGYVIMARLQHVQSNPAKAQEAMRAAEQLLSDYSLSPWRSIWIKSALARLWIAQGNLERASDLVLKSGTAVDDIPHDSEISYLQEPMYLTLMRLHLARGNYDAALALSERLRQNFEVTNRVGQALEMLVLQALAFHGKKDIDQALAVLEKAISLARPEGYCRVFLDEGEPMAKLLFQAKTHRICSGYSAELLSAMGAVSGTELPPAQHLIEPLTLRELEVLKLIEAGNSNQEIADKLVISIPTVKRHISNIYAKLGAESRTQAVSFGRELRLFE
jgi:LuxR family transcriptional regulator, maltose regulon positive regulatory protein